MKITLKNTVAPPAFVRSLVCVAAASFAVTLVSVVARGEDAPAASAPYDPFVAKASDEPAQALQRLRLPEGFAGRVFAAEPLLANPVALTCDRSGKWYVCETFRHHAGVTDNREHMNWLADDLAARTVEDRVAMFRKYLGDDFAKYTTEHDRVRLIEDRDGDGVAETSSVFADGFSDAAAGIGAGLLARDGDVYFACIPDLWLLHDDDRDGRAESRRSLHHGYGVHVAFLGHDLHGLIMGPDGRLYFSIGDRGFNLMADGRRIEHPDTGAVLRCELDGSRLEVFATGLRNPQELSFDDDGNLFTGDNNSDSGDKARWVHVLEGSDAGWRMCYQYITKPVLRGPWNAEKLWHPAHPGQAAYLVPPVANLADGPSGLAYDPGTGLPESYRRHFFLCDFRGVSSLSGIRCFRLEPQGSSFAVADLRPFAQSVLATDVEFGPDGAMYVLDWVEGWNKSGKGRIFRIAPQGLEEDAAAREVRQLLASDFAARSLADNAALLAHADRRVRQEAQFALAARGKEAVATLEPLALSTTAPLPARRHALWALGQIGRREPSVLQPLAPLLRDGDAEIRAQAARVLSEARVIEAAEGVAALTTDASPRVRLLAAEALGRLRLAGGVPPLLALLRAGDNADPFLRHAAALALSRCASIETLAQAAQGESAAMRMGVLLALRHQQSPELARFLHDRDPLLVVEAARAIYDLPLPSALPQLAALASRPPPSASTEPGGQDDALWRRVLAANLRVGGAEPAAAVARLAADPAAPPHLRVEALQILADWQQPAPIDRVLGAWRPIAPRADDARPALTPRIAGLLTAELPEPLLKVAAEVAGRLKLTEAQPALKALLADKTKSSELRAAALAALGEQQPSDLGVIVVQAVAEPDAAIRRVALRLLARAAPTASIPVLVRVLESADVADQQSALAALAQVDDPGVADALAPWLDRLLVGQLPPELELELLEAAQAHANDAVRQRLEQFEASRDPADPISAWREALAGGSKNAGREIFTDKHEVACLRCHKVLTRGGEVGPNLNDVGKRLDRRQLLESIVAPNRTIAQGFETVVVGTDDGQTHVGVLKQETDDELLLMTADGKQVRVEKPHIEERSRGQSAMPDKLVGLLTKRELRDLVAYLESLKLAATAP